MKKVISILLIACLAIGLGFAVKKIISYKSDSWISRVFHKKEITVDLGVNIVEEIKDIAELATSSFIEEFIYEDKQYQTIEKKYYPDSVKLYQRLYTRPQGVQVEFEPTDKIVFIIKGECIAGFDLTKIAPEDINSSGDTVSVILPDPEILDVIVNPEDYEIFDSARNVTDERIDNALITARKFIERDSKIHGILNDALENGKRQIEAFLKLSGYRTVIVQSSSEVYESELGLVLPFPAD